MSESVRQFLFLVTQSKSHDNRSNNAIYKTKIEFKSPSISAHFEFDYKRIFILRYNFFQHLKNIHTIIENTYKSVKITELKLNNSKQWKTI